jgi:O-antigen/teichoic acid export membrane protein
LFLAGLVVARALGPAARAQYALPLTLVSAVWVVVHLSLDDVAGRMLGRGQATLPQLSRLLSAATIPVSVVGALASLGLGIAVRNESLAGASPLVIALATATVPAAVVYQMTGGLLLRIGRIRLFTWTLAAQAVVQLAGVAALQVGLGLTPALALLGLLGGYVVADAALVRGLARHVGWRGLLPGVPPGLPGRALRTASGLHPGTLCNYLNYRIDLLLVGTLVSARQAGLYSLSTALAELVLAGTTALNQAVIADQTALAPQEAVRATLAFVRRTLKLVLGAAALLCVGAYPFVLVVYGPAWAGSVPALMILTVAAIAPAIAGPFNVMLARLIRPATLSAAAASGLLVNVVANLLLIPRLGIAGAALASVASYWSWSIVLMVLFARATGTSPLNLLFARAQAPHAAAAGVIRG